MDSALIVPKYVQGQQLTVENMELIQFEIVRRAYDFDSRSIVYTLKSLEPFPAKATIEVEESHLNSPGEYEPYTPESTMQHEIKNSNVHAPGVTQPHEPEPMEVYDPAVVEPHATELNHLSEMQPTGPRSPEVTPPNRTELAFCQEVLNELLLPKHHKNAYFFVAPVDPIALNIPKYFEVIQKPMDLGTIKQKLETDQYKTADEFKEDVEQIFLNTYQFNPKNATVNVCGRKLEKVFKQKWASKEKWLASDDKK